MFQQNKKKSNKNEHLANKGKLKNSLQKKKLYQEVNQAAILNMICTTKSKKSKLW